MNTLTPEMLSSYRHRIEADLRANILPFWMERTLDTKTAAITAR